MTGRGLHGDCLRQRDWHEKQPEHDRRTRGAQGVNAALGLRGVAGGDAGEGSSGQAHNEDTVPAPATSGHVTVTALPRAITFPVSQTRGRREGPGPLRPELTSAGARTGGALASPRGSHRGQSPSLRLSAREVGCRGGTAGTEVRQEREEKTGSPGARARRGGVRTRLGPPPSPRA